jgi:hypothetical protein
MIFKLTKGERFGALGILDFISFDAGGLKSLNKLVSAEFDEQDPGIVPTDRGTVIKFALSFMTLSAQLFGNLSYGTQLLSHVNVILSIRVCSHWNW